MDIREKIKKLPSSPGVYLMKDSLNSIIYVGKSKNLKSRVGSYFVNSKAHSPKVLKLVKNLKDFDYILTDTEFEALLLECKLIKQIKPRYNRLMKNAKGYCYIRIKMQERYPNIEMCSEIESSGEELYFGPYTNPNTVEKALEGIKEHSRILCTNNSQKSSGCLKYSIGLCIGMCTANPSVENYFSLIEKITGLLKGTNITILTEMEQEMSIAAENFNFEAAAKYRDYINAAKHLVNTAKMINFTETNKNIALLEYLNEEEIKFFLIRYNKLLFSEKYKLSAFSINEIKLRFKKSITFHFGNAVRNSVTVGKNEIDEVHIIYSYLRSKESACKYINISEKWIDNMDLKSIDKAIDKLLLD